MADLKKFIKKIFYLFGYRIELFSTDIELDTLEKEFMTLYNQYKTFTMTTIERMYSLYRALQYIVRYNISGDIVECGVWKGGSAMMCAATLLLLGDSRRTIY